MQWGDYKPWSVFCPILTQAWKRKIELSYEGKFSVRKGHDERTQNNAVQTPNILADCRPD